ncbi:MAG: hypothetical protein P9L92_18440 [Candidatus Electryonea clarkiae]|nr:hypothetical protein [Candidatus Electryonea clarkiae]MDP8286371.1 hypothetical protein [Candidatus Electryonea clarkiae]
MDVLSKKTITVIVVVVLLLVAYRLFIYRSARSRMDEDGTYHNLTDNYSIKVPRGWEDVHSRRVSAAFMGQSIDGAYFIDSHYNMVINRWRDLHSMTLKELMESNIDDLRDGVAELVILDSGPQTINGNKSGWLKFEMAGRGIRIIVLQFTVISGDKWIAMNMNVEADLFNSDIEDDFWKYLSSFTVE